MLRKRRTACIILTLIGSIGLTHIDAQEAGYNEGLFDAPQLPAEILLGLSFGFAFPQTSFIGTGYEGIDKGLALDDPIKRIFIQRAIHEQIFLNFDYNAEREGDFFTGNQNIYSILYRGLDGEFLKELSAGNELLSITGSRFDPIDTGNRDSFALRASAGSSRLNLEGIVRYGVSLSGRKVFRGGKQVIEAELLDIDYFKDRYFFLPDTQIDESSLLLLQTSQGSYDRLIGGREFRYLIRHTDFEFDNSSGRIYLNGVLGEEEELLAYYKKNGYTVGSDQLGEKAVIDETGVRVDFRSGTFPDYVEYFISSDGADYLYLKKVGFNSYWELRNAYSLENMGGGEAPGSISIDLLYSSLGGANINYQGLMDNFIIDTLRGIIFFEFRDADGFYPRPFPGEFPFTHHITPGNPFDPSNPIYGGTSRPTEADSINTLRIRYTLRAESFFLDFDIIEGSVGVTVDGISLSPELYTVDYSTGIITFAGGVMNPSGMTEVTYLYTPFGGGNQELLTALGLRYGSDRFSITNLLSFRMPVMAPSAPNLGEEKQGGIRNSTELSLALGAAPEEAGATASLESSACIALTESNIRDSAVIADMENTEMVNKTPSHLNLTELSVLEDAEVEQNAFSLAYPEVYGMLHGREAYLERQVHEEKILEFRLAADLPGGVPSVSKACFTRKLRTLADIAIYSTYRMYIYLPPGEILPSDSAFILKFLSSEQESLEATIPAAMFETGWNEISFNLAPPFPVTVNGAPACEMSQTGSLNVLKRLGEIEFGLQAGATSIPQDFRIWLDEWHVTESRIFFDKALFAEGTMGYRGGLLNLGSTSLLEDPFLNIGYEWKDGGFTDSVDRKSGKLFCGMKSALLHILSTDVRISHSNEYLREAGSYGDPGFDFQTGKIVNSYSHSIVLDTQIPFFPVLDHSYYRTVTEENDVQLNQTDYILSADREYIDSIVFGERFQIREAFLQTYIFNRSWVFRRVESFETSGSPADSSVSLSLDQMHDSRLLLQQNWGSFSLNLSRDESFSTPYSSYPVLPFESYLHKLNTLFQPVETALPGGHPTFRSDKAEITFFIPLQHHVGFDLNTDAKWQEVNFDDSGARDVTVNENLTVSLPFKPGTQGRLQLTPRISRSFNGSYRKAQDGTNELDVFLITYKNLLMPPFYYLSPVVETGRLNEYTAVDTLAGSPGIAGNLNNRFNSTLALEAQIKPAPWYIPGRTSVSVTGETAREGANYSQKRSTELWIEKVLPLGTGTRVTGGTLTLDAGYEHIKDFTARIAGHSVYTNSSLSIFGKQNRQLSAVLGLSYSSERQRKDDERLYLFPDDPAREIPVFAKADSDTIKGTFTAQYFWNTDLENRPLEQPAALPSGTTKKVRHHESLVLESSYTFTDWEQTPDFSNLPLKIALEHSTRFMRSDYLEFDLSARSIVGLEELITGGSSTTTPAFGFELEVNIHFMF